jgi:hypothetical protein
MSKSTTKLATRSPKTIVVNPSGVVVRRPALTQKRRAAIVRYAKIQAEKEGMYFEIVVNATLKGERMDADKLYDYLERRMYRWNANRQEWIPR